MPRGLYPHIWAGRRTAAEVENTIALQQPAQMTWSNSTAQLNGGWPSYEFGDGTNGFSGILAAAKRRAQRYGEFAAHRRHAK